MSFNSMTGFGSAESSSDGWTMKVECRSVNHRGLDVKVWAPREWSWIEPFVLAKARELLSRGRVEVRVDIVVARSDDARSRHIDHELFAAIAAELREQAELAGIGAPVAGDVLVFEHVRQVAERAVVPEDTAPFEMIITNALTRLIEARAAEGERLRATMDDLVDEVERRVTAITVAAPGVADEFRTRLEQRMRDVLERFDVGEVDERVLLHEVALYADRSDVSEELQRAVSHVERLREVFAATSNDPVGKQVDFYLQELFREANTTGSKSGSLAITDNVIAMKTAIEQMREQAANIE